LDPLIREAVAWIVRLKSGNATVADAEQLMDWRNTSPAHERAFRHALKCWKTVGLALVRSQGSGRESGNPDGASSA
jgi:transmembrane sensor